MRKDKIIERIKSISNFISNLSIKAIIKIIALMLAVTLCAMLYQKSCEYTTKSGTSFKAGEGKLPLVKDEVQK